MFKKINATLKAADATALVIKALRLPVLDWPYDPNELGKKLVGYVCGARPDVFGFGRHNGPPHPVATAAIALAIGMRSPEQFSISTRQMMFLALGNILIDASENLFRYDFDGRELDLIAMAQTDYFEFDEEQRAYKPTPEEPLRAEQMPTPSIDERLAHLSRGIDEFERGRGRS